MPGEMGLSFAPTAQNQKDQPMGGQNSTPIQDAIKVLSLRIPQFVGARGVAPSALMNAPGSGGVPGFGGVPGGLDEFLKRLFGQMGGPMGGMTPGAAPLPSVKPGEEMRLPQGPSRGIASAPNNPQQGEGGPGQLVNPPSMQPGGGMPRLPMMGGKTPFQQF